MVPSLCYRFFRSHGSISNPYVYNADTIKIERKAELSRISFLPVFDIFKRVSNVHRHHCLQSGQGIVQFSRVPLPTGNINYLGKIIMNAQINLV